MTEIIGLPDAPHGGGRLFRADDAVGPGSRGRRVGGARGGGHVVVARGVRCAAVWGRIGV